MIPPAYNARAREAPSKDILRRFAVPARDSHRPMPPAPLFWLVALLLVAATVAALVWPLLRNRGMPSQSGNGTVAEVYRDQKRQLDAELAAGAISYEERDAQLAELAARLGSEIAAEMPREAARSSPRAAYAAALILVAVIPASALLLYAAFGSPDSLRVAAQAGERAPPSHTEIVTMVDKLAVRMKEHPEDPTGWRLLARAQAALGRFPEAVAAFHEAASRSPEDASLLADWADALAMQNKSLAGEPSRLIARALALDPDHPKALSLAASAALERKDYATAIAQWRRLGAQFAPGSDEAKEVDAMIAEAQAAQRGATPTAPLAANALDAGANALDAGANAAGPGANAAAPRAREASPAAAITGRVALDPKLRARVAPSDALFIFARAAAGPRMPLAALRSTAGELPREFRLDDSMAMTPAARLSGAAEVVVEARISKSGNALPAPGDLQGASAPVRPGTGGVSIVINDVVR